MSPAVLSALYLEPDDKHRMGGTERLGREGVMNAVKWGQLTVLKTLRNFGKIM